MVGTEVGSYYALLGVPRDADAAAITSAYRQRARELHPDLNPERDTHDELATISDAYAVLSRTERRNAYDASLDALLATTTAPSVAGTPPAATTAAERPSSPGTQESPEAPTAPAGDPVQAGPTSGVVSQQGTEVFAQLVVAPEVAAAGGIEYVNLTFDQACNSCTGSGFDLSGQRRECSVCLGLKMHPSTGLVCDYCAGLGEVSNVPCGTCHGRKALPQLHQAEVRIPAGATTGTRVRLPRKGATSADGRRKGNVSVDLIVYPPAPPPAVPNGTPGTPPAVAPSAAPARVVTGPRPRVGADPAEFLIAANRVDVGVVLALTYSELRCGTQVLVGTPAGQVIGLNIAPGSAPGQVATVPGHGLAHTEGGAGGRADLHVQFELKMPVGAPGPQEVALLRQLDAQR